MSKVITKSELVQNNGENGNRLWVLIDGKVYDVTDFSHPGGSEILMEDQENDRFDEFESIHSPAAKRQMSQYLIGTIEGEERPIGTKEVTTEEYKVPESSGNSIVYLAFLILLIAGVAGYMKFMK